MMSLWKANHFFRDHLNQRNSEAWLPFADISSAEQSSKMTSSTQVLDRVARESRVTVSVQQSTCQYHDPIFQLSISDGNPGPGVDPMNKFLSEGPSEQYALFCRP